MLLLIIHAMWSSYLSHVQPTICDTEALPSMWYCSSLVIISVSSLLANHVIQKLHPPCDIVHHWSSYLSPACCLMYSQSLVIQKLRPPCDIVHNWSSCLSPTCLMYSQSFAIPPCHCAKLSASFLLVTPCSSSAPTIYMPWQTPLFMCTDCVLSSGVGSQLPLWVHFCPDIFNTLFICS